MQPKSVLSESRVQVRNQNAERVCFRSVKKRLPRDTLPIRGGSSFSQVLAFRTTPDLLLCSCRTLFAVARFGLAPKPHSALGSMLCITTIGIRPYLALIPRCFSNSRY